MLSHYKVVLGQFYAFHFNELRQNYSKLVHETCKLNLHERILEASYGRHMGKNNTYSFACLDDGGSVPSSSDDNWMTLVKK